MFHTRLTRLFSTAAWLILCLAISPVHAETPAIQIFNVTMPINSAVLSPDSKHVAYIGTALVYADLVLKDVDTSERATRVLVRGRKSVEGNWIYRKEPRRVIWASNDLLVVDYGYTVESINLQGKKIAELGERLLRKVEPDNPESTQILVLTDVEDGDIAIVDARSGQRRKFRLPMSGKPVHWAFDKHGELRAVSVVNSAFWDDKTTITNWYKPLGEAEWQKVEVFKVTDNYWIPAHVPDEDNQLVVYSSQGRDTLAVFHYNTLTHQFGEMMAGHPTQDIAVVSGLDAPVFRRVVTNGMKPEQYWFDETWSRMQASVDAVLPDAVNLLSGDPNKRLLVDSRSDTNPGEWYQLDIPAMTLQSLGSQVPTVDPAKERPMQIRTYPARDGMQIPAYLTLPAKMDGPQPTVVVIHGGPALRDYWGWDREVQFLAHAGYVILQPQFRGSDGFGRKFREAGYGQWGLSMQDDITDGVEYLIREGITDRNRICIYGASYGGYAALWGLVKTPDLYRCGVSFAGVSDIEYMFRDSSDASGDKVAREIMRFRIGDAKLNKAQFDAVSPLKHADQIKAPVLLMHGDEDKRVPISHSTKMRAELAERKKTYEWWVFEEEGHGLSKPINQITLTSKLLNFFGKYIGPTKTTPGESGKPTANGTSGDTAP